MEALGLASTWPVDHVAVVAATPQGAAMLHAGPTRFRLASLSKPITAWALLVAVEEGAVDLDAELDPVVDRVPPGVTLRHLLAHAAGFGFDGDEPVAAPARRRIYSNTGIERAADVLARAAEMPFADYLHEAVLAPLGMHHTQIAGSPAHGVWSDISDMNLFLNELLQPQLITAGTRDAAVRPQYPELGGIVPGVGRFTPCPWGLGFEIHGSKSPHWMGRTNSPATYGHFGGSGTMMWVDPDAVAGPVGVVALTDRPFDEWAAEALRRWPELSDALLAEAAAGVGV
jgi:CubicO group peptidase (beta-lactamase class C family)